MGNGAPLAAPWGGRDRVFSTNPIAVAIPAGRELPIVIDMSSSALSHGQVVLAARDGRLVSGPLLVDESGQFTDNPRPLVADPRHRESPLLGAILPQGPKGFGWLLIVELFAGLLSGMKPSYLNVFPPTPEHLSTIGHFLMAIDVSALMPVNEFKAKVDDLITTIKGSRLADGFDAIVLPGERAAQEEARRRREGVPIRDEEWREVIEIYDCALHVTNVAGAVSRSWPPPSQSARRPVGAGSHLRLPESVPARAGPCRAGLPRARVRPPWECARWADGGIGEGAGNRLCTA
jgi:LDH2 family malate/lactate/ureidoglycolate dehydrogenase